MIYLSKDAEYYGNYLYILRCFFKYLKTAVNASQSNTSSQAERERNMKLKLHKVFNVEINYILYAIIKYLINIKDKTPLLNSIISEIITLMPIQFKYLVDMPNLIIPSLVDSLNNSPETIALSLINLESWMTYYPKKPETVVPFIEQNLSKIADSLFNNIFRPMNINVCLASLKWLSKLGGKVRNYSRKKKIVPKTSPIQILTLKLKEKNSERILDFIIDNIIDINIENSINWSNRTFQKKK